MRYIEHNNIKYEYTYLSDDLYDIIGLATTGHSLDAAKRCTKLLRHVEDNEANAMLRVTLGNLIMADLKLVIESTDRAKNSAAPSVAATT